jgi:recombination protein RecT
MTFLGALMTAAQLGLEPNTPLGQAYLIPYNNSRKVSGTWQKFPTCQFQIGYRGLIELAYRSGEVTNIYAKTVFANDKFEYELGLDPKLVHIPAKSNRGDPIYYYAVFQTKGGAKGFDCWSYDDALEHAKRFSKAYDKEKNTFSGPWSTDFDSMARKSVLISALKYAPMKTDFVRAIVNDTAVRSELSSDMLTAPREDEVIDVDVTDESGAMPSEE